MNIIILCLAILSRTFALPTDTVGHSKLDVRNNFVEKLILEELESVREIMINGNNGGLVLDPYQDDELKINLADFGFGGHLYIDNLTVNYLSTFIVEKLTFGILNSRLDFEISVPLLEVLFDKYDLLATVEQITVPGNGAASIHIVKVRVVGWARIIPTLAGHFRVQDCHLTLHVGAFQSKIEGLMGDAHSSEFVNSVLEHLVPELVDFFQEDISRYLNDVFEEAMNDILENI